MSKYSENFVNETVSKPIGGVINKVLEAKLQRIDYWANDQRIKHMLEPAQQKKIWEVFLTKQAMRVSEITSIAFPQRKFSFEDIYEPLSLKKIDVYQASANEFKFFDKHRVTDGSFLILDDAGMGKSTYSKFLVHSLMYKSMKIPVLYELRKYTDKHTLIESIARDLDFNKSTFPRDLLHELLIKGDLVLILDGFDEVPLNLQASLADEISEISSAASKSTLIVTSRPQELVPDLINGITLEFKKFSKDQACSLLQKYDEVADVCVGKNLINELDKVPERFLETPLLITLLYQAYGINNEVANRMCTFYTDIYNALYKGHDLTNKNGYAREKKSKLDYEDFRRITRALSFYMLATNKTSFKNNSEALDFIKKASQISAVKPSTAVKFLDDLLVSVPLMQKDGHEIKFAHKTILEFFAAEYIVYEKDSLKLLTKLYEGSLSSSFDKVFEFISDINPQLFDMVISKDLAQKVVFSEFDDSFSVGFRLLKTLEFQREVLIGVWEDEDSKSIDIAFQKASLPENFSFQMGITTPFDCNGTKYKLSVVLGQKKQDYFRQSWKAISTVFNYQKKHQDDDLPSDISLCSILSVNEWNELKNELILELENNTIVTDLIFEILEYYSYTFIPNGIELISKTSAERLLSNIDKEERLKNQIEDLVSV